MALIGGQEQKIAAADGILGQPVVASHRNSPSMTGTRQIVLAAELLGDLPAVAEIAQRSAELELRRSLKTGKAGAAGRCQHALADAVLQLLLQFVRAHGEDHDAQPGRPSGVSDARQIRVDCRLAAAADDRGGKAGHGDGGLPRPFAVSAR